MQSHRISIKDIYAIAEPFGEKAAQAVGDTRLIKFSYNLPHNNEKPLHMDQES